MQRIGGYHSVADMEGNGLQDRVDKRLNGRVGLCKDGAVLRIAQKGWLVCEALAGSSVSW